MAPKGKSSATSATRKKHARKAATAHGVVEEPQMPKEKKPKGKDKKSKTEPRKKVYIPPVKPAPVQPDPLDTLGLAQRLPPELLVVLRRLSKKDATTKRRALEDLQTAWVGRAQRGDEGEHLVYTLQETIPVWVRPTMILVLRSLSLILKPAAPYPVPFLTSFQTHTSASNRTSHLHLANPNSTQAIILATSRGRLVGPS